MKTTTKSRRAPVKADEMEIRLTGATAKGVEAVGKAILAKLDDVIQIEWEPSVPSRRGWRLRGVIRLRGQVEVEG